MQKLKPDDPATIGPYAIIGRIGEGGMGCVYLGLRNGKFAAVKVMAQLYSNIPEFRRRFRREIEVVQRIQPGFTAQILDHDAEGMQLWYASEYVPGLNLAEAVRASRFEGDALVNLIYSLCEALKPVHAAGIVHRDFKPANIILGPSGVKVVDFGVAADSDAPALTMTGQVIGTASYMSPEQIAGKEPAPAWDVFALGCVIVYAATGRTPYAGKNRMEIMLATSNPLVKPDLSGVPKDLLGLVASCLQHNASDRPTLEAIMRRLPKTQAATAASTKWMPASVSSKVVEATRVAERLAPTRKEAPPQPTTPKPAAKKKSRTWLMAWAAAVMALVAVLGYASTLNDDDPQKPAQAPNPTQSASRPPTVEVPQPTFKVSSLKGKGTPKVVKVTVENRQLHLTLKLDGGAEDYKAATANSCLKLSYKNGSLVTFRPDEPEDDTPANVLEFRSALDFPGAVYFIPKCTKEYGVAGGQWLGDNKVPNDGFFGDGDILLPVIDAYTKGGKLRVVMPEYKGFLADQYKTLCLKTAEGPRRATTVIEAVNRERGYFILTFNAPRGTLYTGCSGDNKVSYKGKGVAIP